MSGMESTVTYNLDEADYLAALYCLGQAWTWPPETAHVIKRYNGDLGYYAAVMAGAGRGAY